MKGSKSISVAKGLGRRFVNPAPAAQKISLDNVTGSKPCEWFFRIDVYAPSLNVRPLEHHPFGCEILDKQIPMLTPREMEEVRQLFNHHGLLVFRNQDLHPRDEINFAYQFPWNKEVPYDILCGPLGNRKNDAAKFATWKMPGHEEIQVRGYAQLDDHFGVNGFMDTQKNTKEYHADGIHEYLTPPVMTSLYNLETPSVGGDTLFISGALAYDMLSVEMKKKCDNLYGYYRREPWPMNPNGICADFDNKTGEGLGKIYSESFDATHWQEEPDREPTQIHPFVFVHPDTGRKAIITSAMWLHCLADENGNRMTCRESHELLREILEPVENLRYAHRWQVGDFVCFDNRTLMHSASPMYDYQDLPGAAGRRVLHQIELCSDEIPNGPIGRWHKQYPNGW